MRFTSLRPLLGGMPESGGPGEREGWRMREVGPEGRGAGAGLVDE